MSEAKWELPTNMIMVGLAKPYFQRCINAEEGLGGSITTSEYESLSKCITLSKVTCYPINKTYMRRSASCAHYALCYSVAPDESY